MRRNTWLIAALLFGSGFCALVYQIGWVREFRLIFGASTAASAAVLAVFIGGLGAGGLLLGSQADRHARPLLFYAQLETIVALSAALSPLLLSLVRAAYLATGGSETLGSTLATGGRLVLSALVLALPTLAMGGTLPAAARAATRTGDVGRRDTAALYALNTLGAVAGCLVATFALLELFGTRQTIWLAAGVNLLIAITARSLDRSRAPDPGHESSETAAADEQRHPVGRAFTARLANHEGSRHAAFLLTASAAVGFAFFLLELVWYRLLAPLLGGSVFTFGLVLAIALAGLGLGGLLYALAAASRAPSLSALATTCLVEAAAVALTYALGDRVAILALSLLPLGTAGFTAKVAGWTLVTAIVVLPPAIVSGYQFPLLIALFGRGRERLGRQIGLAYGANTAGAIAGSLAGGFGILPWLSAPDAWRFVAVLLAMLGTAAAVLAHGRGEHRALFVQAIAGAMAIAGLFAAGPTAVWRHAGVGAGRVPQDTLSSPNRLRAWSNTTRRTVEWERDGVESGVALAYDARGYSFVVNGKADGNARGDAGTQVMLGLLGALNHPAPKSALVIGLGTGSTAGWLGAIPSMSRVDVVELEPVVLEVARASRAVNQDVLKNPKVHVTIGDARETLLTSSRRYDVIASEPSNPYRAGIASLFTQEYYHAASNRLADNGVFAQWVQAYEIDARTLRTIYATLASVFPNIESWQTTSNDLVLIAGKHVLPSDPASLAARITEQPYRTALANAWRAQTVEDVIAHRLAVNATARAIASSRGVEVNTDDRNVVEFGLARSVGQSGLLMVPALRLIARTLDANGAGAAGSAVSPARVDTAWVAFNASEGWFVEWPPQAAPIEGARQAALRQYYEQKDPAGARTLWRQQVDPPRNLTELAMAADLEAEAGSDGALPLIEQLREFQPAEADIILATLRGAQGRLTDMASALEAALIKLRTDPWPLDRYKGKALGLVEAFANRSPQGAARMFEALREPFALRALDDSRLQLAAALSRRLDFPRLCRRPVDALDAYPPWTSAFLQLRMDCYRETNDPRLARAARDLDAFLSAEMAPLVIPR